MKGKGKFKENFSSRLAKCLLLGVAALFLFAGTVVLPAADTQAAANKTTKISWREKAEDICLIQDIISGSGRRTAEDPAAALNSLGYRPARGSRVAIICLRIQDVSAERKSFIK